MLDASLRVAYQSVGTFQAGSLCLNARPKLAELAIDPFALDHPGNRQTTFLVEGENTTALNNG